MMPLGDIVNRTIVERHFGRFEQVKEVYGYPVCSDIVQQGLEETRVNSIESVTARSWYRAPQSGYCTRTLSHC